MKAAGLAGIVIIVIILFALFVPVFPATSNSGTIFGVNYGVHADVSLSFLVSHCGAFVNAHSTASLGGITITHKMSNGYNFACNFSV